MAENNFLDIATKIGHAGQEVPGTIKQMSVDSLLAASKRAADLGFSATGRPDWVRLNAHSIRVALLMPVVVDGNARRSVLCWRCHTIVLLAEGIFKGFSLDVAHKEFLKLEDVDTAWDLMDFLLLSTPNIPLEGT